jgi:alanine racemase
MTATEMLATMTEEHIRNMKAKIPMGRLVEADEVAELAGTISYEILTGFTGRLPRVWMDDGED